VLATDILDVQKQEFCAEQPFNSLNSQNNPRVILIVPNYAGLACIVRGLGGGKCGLIQGCRSNRATGPSMACIRRRLSSYPGARIILFAWGWMIWRSRSTAAIAPPRPVLTTEYVTSYHMFQWSAELIESIGAPNALFAGNVSAVS